MADQQQIKEHFMKVYRKRKGFKKINIFHIANPILAEKKYLKIVSSILSKTKCTKVCRDCVKSTDNHHKCCFSCGYLGKKGCINKNLNCALWICKRLRDKMNDLDLKIMGRIAFVWMKNDLNRDRCDAVEAQFMERKTYYGALFHHYIGYFSTSERIRLCFIIKS